MSEIKCPYCGGDLTIMANLMFSAPMNMFHNLSKSKMRSKDFVVWGVDWGDADWICKNCGNIKIGNNNSEE